MKLDENITHKSIKQAAIEELRNHIGADKWDNATDLVKAIYLDAYTHGYLQGLTKGVQMGHEAITAIQSTVHKEM